MHGQLGWSSSWQGSQVLRWSPTVLVCSLCLDKKHIIQYVWECTELILPVGQSAQIKLCQPYPSGGGCKQWCLVAPLALRVPRAPRGAPPVSQTSLFSLSCLLFRSCSFSPQLSCRSNCSFYTGVYLSVLMGRGDFSILLCCDHPGPPSIMIWYLYMLWNDIWYDHHNKSS